MTSVEEDRHKLDHLLAMSISRSGSNNTQSFSSHGNRSEKVFQNGSVIGGNQTQLDFVMRLILYPSCIVAGVLGNILVVAIIMRRRKAKRSNVYETFLLNLAFTDCGVLLIQFLPGIIIGPMVQWNIGRFACYAIIPLGDSFLPASSLTLVTISLLRYRGIMHPFKRKLSEKASILVLLLIWIISTVLAITPFVRWLKAVDMPGKDYARCVYQVPWLERFLWFNCISIALFFVPISVIWIIYFRLRTPLFEAVDDVNLSSKDSKRTAENRKAIKMIFIVTVLFTLLYLPFFGSTYLHFFVRHSHRPLRILNEIALFLVCFNSTVNPIIYCIYNKSYRRELCIMFRCRRFYYRRRARSRKRHSSAGPMATFKSGVGDTKISFSSNWV